MAVWLEKLGLFARSPDARPLAEIAADIDAELGFHVEESARDLCAEGLDAEAARAEALKRFGDYGRIRRECARTQMGERVMLQRIQIVLTAVLIAAVGLLLWSNHEARAAMVAERQQNAELLARLEAQFTAQILPRVLSANSVPWGNAQPTVPAGSHPTIDRKSIPSGARAVDDVGDYLGADGRAHTLENAAGRWSAAFDEQSTSWRHGLKLAERMSVLPGAQGAELLAQIWIELSVEHREQAMKPFVFGGGHPNALEVLALGIADTQEVSVRERAALYLQTYAWKNLLDGDGAAAAWLAEWRDRPVDEVLRANATRWARDLGTLGQQYERPPLPECEKLLAVVDQIRPDTFMRAGVDLHAILEANGVCAMTDRSFGLQDADAKLKKIRSWCSAK